VETEPLRRRQTKGAATDILNLTPPRHTPTLPAPGRRRQGLSSIATAEAYGKARWREPDVILPVGTTTRAGRPRTGGASRLRLRSQNDYGRADF